MASEPATRVTIINPILRALGYDTENLNDVDTELSANIFPDTKAPEKVDYAIKKDGDVVILIEAKACDNPLDKPEKEFRQLYDYHNKFEKSKFGILTNGIKWICYNEIEENKLDYNPFFVFNLFEYSDADLEKFLSLSKEYFTVDDLTSTAKATRMSTLFKARVLELIENPLDMKELFKTQYRACGIRLVSRGSKRRRNY